MYDAEGQKYLGSYAMRVDSSSPSFPIRAAASSNNGSVLVGEYNANYCALSVAQHFPPCIYLISQKSLSLFAHLHPTILNCTAVADAVVVLEWRGDSFRESARLASGSSAALSAVCCDAKSETIVAGDDEARTKNFFLFLP